MKLHCLSLDGCSLTTTIMTFQLGSPMIYGPNRPHILLTTPKKEGSKGLAWELSKLLAAELGLGPITLSQDHSKTTWRYVTAEEGVVASRVRAAAKSKGVTYA